MTIFMSPSKPEAICRCLQTCNFVLMLMLMINVCVESFNFIRASMQVMIIFMSLLMYCLRPFVVYKHVILV